MSKRTIWKFPLALSDSLEELVSLDLPRGATVLKIAEQGSGRFFLWALVDPRQSEKETRLVFSVGTGHEFPAHVLDNLLIDHRETVLAHGGSFVVHFFVGRA